jgi:hypothetical protein
LSSLLLLVVAIACRRCCLSSLLLLVIGCDWQLDAPRDPSTFCPTIWPSGKICACPATQTPLVCNFTTVCVRAS